jgi:hypothetical protein
VWYTRVPRLGRRDTATTSVGRILSRLSYGLGLGLSGGAASTLFLVYFKVLVHTCHLEDGQSSPIWQLHP